MFDKSYTYSGSGNEAALLDEYTSDYVRQLGAILKESTSSANLASELNQYFSNLFGRKMLANSISNLLSAHANHASTISLADANEKIESQLSSLNKEGLQCKLYNCMQLFLENMQSLSVSLGDEAVVQRLESNANFKFTESEQSVGAIERIGRMKILHMLFRPAKLLAREEDQRRCFEGIKVALGKVLSSVELKEQRTHVLFCLFLKVSLIGLIFLKKTQEKYNEKNEALKICRAELSNKTCLVEYKRHVQTSLLTSSFFSSRARKSLVSEAINPPTRGRSCLLGGRGSAVCF